MKRSVKNWMLPFVMLSLVVNAYAYDTKVDGIYYNLSENDHTASVVDNGHQPYKGEVIVPESFTNVDGQEYTVTSVGRQAFNKCFDLNSVVLPSTVTNIEERAFFNCPSLVSVTMPAVTSFGEGAFIYCSGLQAVELPEGTTAVSENMFSGCSSLESVTLPSTVNSIGNTAFGGCTALTILNVKAENVPQCSADAFTDIDKEKCTLNIVSGTEVKYQNAEGWKDFTNIIGKYAGVESVANDGVNVMASDGIINVIGVREGQPVEVYNVSGQLLYSGNDTTISIAVKGLYVVRVNNKSFKVLL